MIRIGTSGWVYGGWRGPFYPRTLPQRQWLQYYVEHFDTVELNATTYRLPTPAQVDTWSQAVPANFRYTVKLSRLITHRKEWPERVDRYIENYFDRMRGFDRRKLAQILVQFPPSLKRDDDRLDSLLSKLPRDFRYVVEFRNASWMDEHVRDLLASHRVAFCIHDYPGLTVPSWVTSGQLAYVRLHGHTGLYEGSYPRRELTAWNEAILALAERAQDVYVYFNNDTDAAAPHDALILRQITALSKGRYRASG